MLFSTLYGYRTSINAPARANKPSSSKMVKIPKITLKMLLFMGFGWVLLHLASRFGAK